jgi:DNA-binding transcriptional regulator YdaS (Cro superfamily)
MLIADFLKLTSTSPDAFAQQLGVHSETVRTWVKGLRTPRPGMVKRIGKVTGGKVTPADCMAPAMEKAA